ncbi:hypothetical protein [Streptomyces sp. NPDC057909]|uniref:hypothetical protein n=1 Tax=Streptomyces sp. NPDC057909 TaxID=3346277 RepID=UPI0036F05A2C
MISTAEHERREATRRKYERAVDQISGFAFWVAAFGVPAALVWDASWYISIYATLYVLAAEAAWQLYIGYLHIKIFVRRREAARIEARTRQTNLEIVQLQILIAKTQAHTAAIQAQESAMRAEIAEKDRLHAQLRTELATKQLLQEQRNANMAVRRLELAQLETKAEWAEYRVTQAELRLEQARMWRLLARSQDEAQDKILAAYREGYGHGRQGVSFTTLLGRHLRLVEDSA